MAEEINVIPYETKGGKDMKITFLGAGSTVFCKNVLGDCILSDKLGDFEIALLDIDPERLEESYFIVNALREKYKPSVTVKKSSTQTIQDISCLRLGNGSKKTQDTLTLQNLTVHSV